MEHRARIMVVQDDPVLRGLVSGSLRPEGHEIIELKSPLEAIRLAAIEYQTIDLVLTKVDCQPITGIEMAKQLVRKGIDVPVLFMLASHALAGVMARSIGQASIIRQPFTGAELRASVRRCLSNHRSRG